MAEIALTEDVVKRKPLVVSPTFMEWAADGNVEQIRVSRTNTGTIYTVPDNFTFFMTSANVAVRNAGAAGNAQIYEKNGTIRILSSFCVANSEGHSSSSFIMPLRFNAKETITASITGVASISIQGFLLPLKISIR